MESNSPSLKLNSVDLKKVGVGAVVALLGAGATWLEQTVGGIDFGPAWTPMATAANAVLVNLLRKWVVNHSGK